VKFKKTVKRLKTGENIRLIAFGDSLTYGWMVNKGYIEFLNELLENRFPGNKITIINRGIPGNTASDGIKRLHDDVLESSPDLVFIQFALNDAYTGDSPENYRDNICTIIRTIREKTESEILLLTSVPLNNRKENEHINKYYRVLSEISKSEDLPLVEVHKYWERKLTEGYDFFNLVQADMVHPTDDGYRLMAEAIMEYFQ
jgi:lysophospholipase L1-like esterase